MISIFILLGLLPTLTADASPPKPLFADPNYNGSCDPEIVWNEHTSEYFLYYTARRATLENGSFVGTPIGAVSSPDLIHWTFRGYCSFDGHPGRPDMSVTFWAPGIISVEGNLHMFVTYKHGATPPWGGSGVIRHYIASLNDPIRGWKFAGAPDFGGPDPIDATIVRSGAEFLAFYRAGNDGGIQWAASRDLTRWELRGKCSGDINGANRGFGYHEAPYVFKFGGFWWMLTDPHEGIAVFRSEDGRMWKQTPRILLNPGKGSCDASRARHPSVIVKDGRAFIFYHVEPGRPYPTPPPEERTVEQKKTFLQIAELKIENNVLVCDRDAPIELPSSGTGGTVR